jgi:hypothetical protein
MTLAIEDLRFAVTDVRQRHQNLVDLIQSGARQALGMLQLYIALAVASLSGSAVILLSNANTLPRPLGFGLGGFSVTIVAGAICTLVAMWPNRIRLAGRDPDFWQWADRDDITPDHVLRTYLAIMAENLEINRKLNRRMGAAMLSAKCAGVAAPLIGSACGATALLVGF